jgi:hypothetical protein
VCKSWIGFIKNKVLRRISGSKKEVGRNYILRGFITCTLQLILLVRSNQGG